MHENSKKYINNIISEPNVCMVWSHVNLLICAFNVIIQINIFIQNV
jgi:hypothetical protein